MAWNDLSISQRSQLMNIFRRNGVTSLSDMRNMYDSSLSSFNSSLEETTDSFGRPKAYFDNGGEKDTYTPSEDIIKYIKDTEAFRPNWYLDGNGIPTIGYGFTGPEAKRLFPNGITREQADKYFADSLSKRIPILAKDTPNWNLLSQQQRDALLSYHYNVGEGSYRNKHPKLQEALTNKDWENVMLNMDAGYNDKKNPGLRKRRDFERDLFKQGIPQSPVHSNHIANMLPLGMYFQGPFGGGSRANGGNLLNEGGDKNDNYRDQLVYWATNNPGALWANNDKSYAARQWLEQNYPEDFASLYWGENEGIRNNIDRKMIPVKAQERLMQDKVRTRDKAAPYVAGALAGSYGLAAGLSALPAVASGISSFAKAHPVLMRAVDAAGSIDSVRNLATDNGIQKTVRKAREGNTWGAIKSGAGDAFDLVGLGDAVRMSTKLANKAYRGYHAFNTVTPYGYDNISQRGKDWVKSMLLEKEYTAPTWRNSRETQDYINRFKENFGEQASEFGRLAREDAWALYTGQAPKNNMYIRNADGTYSYNPDKLKEYYTNDEHFGDNIKFAKQNTFDSIGLTHGGLWKAENSKLGSVGPAYDHTTYGNLRIEDLWDLQPFSRGGDALFADRLNTKLTEKFGSSALRHKAQDFREWMFRNKHWGEYGKKDDLLGKILKPLDDRLNQYRFGYKAKLVKDGSPAKGSFIFMDAPNGYHYEEIPIPKTADKAIDFITDNKLTRRFDKKLKDLEIGSIIGGKPFYMRTNVPYTATTKPITGELKPFEQSFIQEIKYGWNPPENYVMPDLSAPQAQTFMGSYNIKDFSSDLFNPVKKKNSGGSIHIDPSKKGTFTAAATKHDMGVQEFASYVSAHPDDFSSAMRKKAAFAKAAKKFKHSFGGIKF